jgi:hypothetical protein
MIFPDGARFGETNLVLHGRAQRHIVKDFAGPLSIKSVMNGQVGWIVDGHRLLVDEGSFLVLNDGQKYSMNVEAPQRVCPDIICIELSRQSFKRRRMPT